MSGVAAASDAGGLRRADVVRVTARYGDGWLPPAWHFGIALLLFHPMLWGWIIVGGTDSLFGHYPNLLFGLRSLREYGQFQLWNPYIFAGFDFTKSIHAHFLDPMWMPLALLPDQYVFQAVTFVFFACNFLVGIVWYRIARLWVADRWLAMLAGVVAQSGMFFWWTTTAFIATPLYLYSTLCIYLLVTTEQRTPLRQYLWLSALLLLMFVKSHPFYVLSFSLPVGVVFLVRGYPRYLSAAHRWHNIAFAAAGLTAALLAAYRIVPPLLSVARGATLEQVWLNSFFFRSYMLLTEFIPQAWGIYLGESNDISVLLENSGYHTQIHNALYFGILPLLISYVAARRSADASIRYLGWLFLLCVWASEFAFAPLSDIMSVLDFPVWHEVLLRISSNFVLLFLLIFALRGLPKLTSASIAAGLREIMLLAVLVVLATATLWLRVVHEATRGDPGHSLEWMFLAVRLGIVAGIVGMFAAWRTTARRAAGWLASWLACGVGVAVVLVSLRLQHPRAVLNGDEMTLRAALVVLLTLPVAILCVWRARRQSPMTPRAWVAIAGSAVPLVIALIVPLKDAPLQRAYMASGLSAMLGTGLFIVLLSAGATMLLAADRSSRFRVLTPLMLVLTTADLVGSFEIYSYVNVPTPFVSDPEHLFPVAASGFRKQPDESDAQPQMNRLRNPELALLNGRPADWNLGGGPRMRVCGSPDPQSDAVDVCYDGNDGDGNLFQDVTLPHPARVVSFGAWLRVKAPAQARLLLTDPTAGSGQFSDGVANDGAWHWIGVSLNSTGRVDNVRVHINLPVAGEVALFAPKVVTGHVVMPDRAPSGIAMPDIPAPAPVLDFDDFRVNDPAGPPGTSAFSDFGEIARLPTYGGVDSDLPADLVEFIPTLIGSHPPWLMRGGIKSAATDPRFLDLFGVAYQARSDGSIEVRPNALARFSAFNAFRVERDVQAAARLLKNAAYDPTRQLVVDQVPSNIPSVPATRFTPLHYTQTGADRLTLAISPEIPRLILFDDHYSPSWVARWNGQVLQVLHGNGIFMAVALPLGAGTLQFSFEPVMFYRLAHITEIGGGALLLAIMLEFFWRGRPRRSRWIAAS